ncbi:MAG: hypothetical protein ACPGU7_03040 [Gammaproteobacteria bacterium]
MEEVFRSADHAQLRSLMGRLNEAGIPAWLKPLGDRANPLLTALYVEVDAQRDDAIALISDPEHTPRRTLTSDELSAARAAIAARNNRSALLTASDLMMVIAVGLMAALALFWFLKNLSD